VSTLLKQHDNTELHPDTLYTNVNNDSLVVT